MIAAVIVPDSATHAEVARQAAAAHLHIITNGTRAVLSPIVPSGWAKVGNTGNTANTLGVHVCA